MSTLFDAVTPLKPTPPKKTPPPKKVAPALPPPDDPPIPVLQQALNVSIGLKQFANRVATTVATHQAAHGYTPKPAQVLATVTSPTWADPVGAATGKPTQLRSQAVKVATQSPDDVLTSLAAHTAAGDFDGYMRLYGDQLQALIQNPETRAKAVAALAHARDVAAMYKRAEAGGTTLDVVKGVALAPVKTTVWTARVADSLVRDTAELQQWTSTRGKRGSAGFPNLQKTSPAVAQVVQGLVYSPVGIGLIVKAGVDDTNAARQGDFSFKHTRKIAVETGNSFLMDLAHPDERFGYFVLDLFAIASVGTGTAARLGRAGTAVREGATLAEAARAFERPHPTRTFRLSHDGFAEEVKMAQNPFVRMASEYMPGVGLRARQRRADVTTARHEALGRGEGPAPLNTDLFGNPIEALGPPGRAGDLGRWATNLLSTRAVIGRAHDKRQVTEYRSMAAIGEALDSLHGAAEVRDRVSVMLRKDFTKGLTPGERKAIELLSYPVKSGTNPIQKELENRTFFLENGFGDAQAQKRQIALTFEARDALANPRPKFQEKVDAVMAVQAYTEQVKAAMGLTEEQAAGRVAFMGEVFQHAPEYAQQLAAEARVQSYAQLAQRFPDDERIAAKLEAAREDLAAKTVIIKGNKEEPTRLKVGDEFVPINDPAPGSWYFPYMLKHKPGGRTFALGRRASNVAETGLSPAARPSELVHEITGAAYIHGDYRLDIPELYGERLHKTIRAFIQWTEHQDAWERASDVKVEPDWVPIRDIRNLPPHLRRAVSQFTDEHLDAQAVTALPEELHKWLFPEHVGEGEHVRWLDPTLVGESAKHYIVPGAAARAFARVNDALRIPVFYAQPKYALNGVTNLGLLMLDEGFVRSYANLIRAIQVEERYGVENADWIKSLVGEGKSESYLSPLSGRVNKAVGRFWNHFTDEKFRVASWLYYAKNKEYETREDITRLRENVTGNNPDPKLKADFLDITERSKDAIVNYDRMSQWERARLRNYIFVYPWQRGSFMWSFRTIYEHPARTALLATLGNDAYQDEEWLREASAWVRRTGYIPLDWAADKLDLREMEKRVGLGGTAETIGTYNSMSINPFAVLGDAERTATAMFYGDQYASVGDLLGPPGQFAMHAVTGLDRNGNPYKGSQLIGALADTLNFIPLLAAWQRTHRPPEKELAPFRITDRASLEARLNSAIHQAVIQPGWLYGLGSLIYGSQGEMNLTALSARYWRQDATAKQRHERSVRLLDLALTAQGDFLERPVPKRVRDAVHDQAQLSWVLQQKRLADQKELTPKEILVVTIRYYHDAGRYDQKEYERLLGRAYAIQTKADIGMELASIKTVYGGMDALREWNDDVSTTNALQNQLIFDQRTGMLHQAGLSPQRVYSLTGEQRKQYAFSYIAYLDGRSRLDHKEDTTEADLRAYDDAHDKPVVIDGKRLPSPVRFQYSEGSTSKQRAEIAAVASKNWENLTSAEKAILGKEVSPAVQDGWRWYHQSVAATRKANDEVTYDDKVEIAKAAQRYYPGFLQDWLWSQQSRAERLMLAPQYKTFPAELQQVVQLAKGVGDALQQARIDPDSDVSISGTTRDWGDYVDTVLREWLKKKPAAQRALQPYGKTFLKGLIGNG